MVEQSAGVADVAHRGARVMPERGAVYWNAVIDGRGGTRPQTTWRAYADRVNTDYCAAWWPPQRPRRVLKTDLFDEASGVGLWPTVTGRCAAAYGIDYAIGTILMARSRYTGARAATADARDLPFVAAAFDLVISNSTLDHFERKGDLLASLREINRVLAPGGRLLLTLDNPANPVVALRNALPFRLLNRIGLVPYFVGATAGPRSGRRLLEEAGFEVVHVGALMHGPRAAAVAVASLLDVVGSARAQRVFARLLGGLEGLSRCPTRFLTGYFVAFVAEKPNA